MLHICVAHVSLHVHIRVFHVYTYVCYKSTEKSVLVKHVVRSRSAPVLHVNANAFFKRAHVWVAGERKCVLQVTEMCFPDTHTHVFQVYACVCLCSRNTCLLSDERACVCLCVRVPGAHKCVCLRVHTCVFHVYTYVFRCTRIVYTYVYSLVHTCVFQLDTCMCSRRTHVCYQLNMCVCLLRAHMYVCSRVHICVFHV